MYLHEGPATKDLGYSFPIFWTTILRWTECMSQCSLWPNEHTDECIYIHMYLLLIVILIIFQPSGIIQWILSLFMPGLYVIKCYGMAFSLLPLSLPILSVSVLVEGQPWPLKEAQTGAWMSACRKGCYERLKYPAPYTNITALPNVQSCTNCFKNPTLTLFCTSILLGGSQETNSKELKFFSAQDDIFVVASKGRLA